MKKSKYSFLVFLSAYLNQIDLSLDRSRWDKISGLRDYYKTQISPEKLARFMMKRFELDKNRINYIYFPENYNFFVKIKFILQRICNIESTLSHSECYFICQKLYELNEFLKGENEPHKLEIEKLRIDFAKINSSSLRFRISKKDWIKVLRIEHYLQNETLDCIKMTEFVPAGFK